ncbi:MAG: hypothetical protein ACM3VZ_02355 [Acidobacteriota bacterium]
MTNRYPFSLIRWLTTGTAASLLSMLALAWHGRRRHGSSTSLINAPSHWIFGDRALRANGISWRFTLLGSLIHHASSLFWSAFYEATLNARPSDTSDTGPDAAAPREPSTGMIVLNAAALTTLAWLVDTRIVPDRLSPGFQRRSSKMGMLLIYGSFAAGLMLGARTPKRNHSQTDA